MQQRPNWLQTGRLEFTHKTVPPHLIRPSVDRPHSPSQRAFGSNQPFCHSTPSEHTDRPTGRQTTDGIGDRFTALALMLAILIESDALIIKITRHTNTHTPIHTRPTDYFLACAFSAYKFLLHWFACNTWTAAVCVVCVVRRVMTACSSLLLLLRWPYCVSGPDSAGGRPGAQPGA